MVTPNTGVRRLPNHPPAHTYTYTYANAHANAYSRTRVGDGGVSL